MVQEEKLDPAMEAMVSGIDDQTKEELLKKIDQKIQELEEEEQKEKAVIPPKVEVLPKKGIPKVENVVSLDEDFVTDDQFFDDFFNDDDE